MANSVKRFVIGDKEKEPAFPPAEKEGKNRFGIEGKGGGIVGEGREEVQMHSKKGKRQIVIEKKEETSVKLGEEVQKRLGGGVLIAEGGETKAKKPKLTKAKLDPKGISASITGRGRDSKRPARWEEKKKAVLS